MERTSLPRRRVFAGNPADGPLLPGRYKALLSVADNTPIEAGQEGVRRDRDLFPNALDMRDALVRNFRLALYLSVAIIGASVRVLPFAQDISDHGQWVWVVSLGLLGLAACLASYVRLMLEGTRLTPSRRLGRNSFHFK